MLYTFVELLLVDEVPEGWLGGLVLLLRHDVESLHAGAPGAVPGQAGHRDLSLSHSTLFAQVKSYQKTNARFCVNQCRIDYSSKLVSRMGTGAYIAVTPTQICTKRRVSEFFRASYYLSLLVKT